MDKPVRVRNWESNGEVGKKPRIVLADDHPGMVEEIRLLLARDFDVVGSVSEGRALLSAVSQLKPDAIVCDINMPLVDGLEAGRGILRAGLCPAVIILTLYNEPELVHSALESGIRGYVLKVDAGEELALAVETVVGGGTYVSSGVLVAGQVALTDAKPV
jgi:DNA-binding NarL/FixJ family response regulator